jgi:hypothetical protein
VRESKIDPVLDHIQEVEVPSVRPYFVPMYGDPPQQAVNPTALNVWLFHAEFADEPAYHKAEVT